jgi:hypothetical protein
MLQASVPNVFICFLDVRCKCVHLDVAYVLHICCKVFYLHIMFVCNVFQVFSGVFAGVSDVCFKCLTCHLFSFAC